MVQVSFYGRLRDSFGEAIEIELPQEGLSIGALRKRIFDGAKGEQRIRAIVGELIVGDDHIVTPSDHIEFIPPVSGG